MKLFFKILLTRIRKLPFLVSAAIFFLISGMYSPALAHEVYVLSHEKFSQDLQAPTINTLQALTKPENLRLTFFLVTVVFLVLLLLLYFRYTKAGFEADRQLKKLSRIGLFVIRLALSASFLYAGHSNSIFGPELSLNNLPLHAILPYAEYLIGVMLLLGLFTEIAAVLSLLLFGLAVFSNGIYLLTYTNYLGEIIALILFGSRFLSLDRLIFGQQKRFSNLKAYENTIIRVGYGAALLYATINIKIIHSQIPLDVINQYHLNQINWLFPQDPLLIVMGAAIVETIMVLFIIVGFTTRITNVVLMFYLTLSILFFKESVWPHYMLYGISLSILFNGAGTLSIDESFGKFIKNNSSLRKVFLKK